MKLYRVFEAMVVTAAFLAGAYILGRMYITIAAHQAWIEWAAKGLH